MQVFVFLLASSYLYVLASSSRLVHGRPKGGLLPAPRLPDGHKLPEDNWFTQRLDHFDDSNRKTWQQRFFYNNTFSKSEDSPVFLMIGGEGTASPVWLVIGNMMNYAQEFDEGSPFVASTKSANKKRPKKKCLECGMEQAIAKKNCEGCGFVFEKKPKNVDLFKTMPLKNVTKQRQKLEYRADILHHQHNWDIVILMMKKHGSSSTLSCYGTEGAGAAFIGCCKGEAAEGAAVVQDLFRTFVREYKGKEKKSHCMPSYNPSTITSCSNPSTITSSSNPSTNPSTISTSSNPSTNPFTKTLSSNSSTNPSTISTSSDPPTNPSTISTSSNPPTDPSTISTSSKPSTNPFTITLSSNSSTNPSTISTSSNPSTNLSTITTSSNSFINPSTITTSSNPSTDPSTITTSSNPSTNPSTITTSSNPSTNPSTITTSSNPLLNDNLPSDPLSNNTSSANTTLLNPTIPNTPKPTNRPLQPAMVMYVVNEDNIIAGGFPLPNQRTLHEKTIPSNSTCVLITSTREHYPAPIVMQDPDSILEKGKIYAFPNTSLRAVFQTPSNQLRMCPYNI